MAWIGVARGGVATAADAVAGVADIVAAAGAPSAVPGEVASNGIAGIGSNADTGAGSSIRAAAVGMLGGPNSSSIELPAPSMITPPHTEQRARRPVAGIFVGSTRNTERHSGHETFTCPP